MDAETDHYAPELVRDNSSIDAPGTFESGYHLTADLIDQSIRFLADTLPSGPSAMAPLARFRSVPCAAPGSLRAHPELR